MKSRVSKEGVPGFGTIGPARDMTGRATLVDDDEAVPLVAMVPSFCATRW